MHLTRLKAQYFRNFESIDFLPNPDFNLIYGLNGSGKTSLLEAIHFLSLGRSFRTHLVNRIIQYNAARFTVFGTVASADNNLNLNIGIEKDKVGKLRLKIGNENATAVSQLAKTLPMQILNPDSYQLISEGPRLRRAFLDWGVFHVEPLFISLWQRLQKALLQRNAALQRQVPLAQITAWDNELIPAALEINKLRKNYFKQLTLVMIDIFHRLASIENFTMTYLAGWDLNEDLATVLLNSFPRDRALGYTQYGPRRADISFKVNNMPAQDILSRGEQKLLVTSLKLAQGVLLRQAIDKSCIYLLDDLAAEPDSNHRAQVIEVLSSLDAQVFITAVDTLTFKDLLRGFSKSMFHVEHDQVKCIV